MNPCQSKAIKSIVVLLLVYQLQRLLFLFFNADAFQGISNSDILLAFINGIRFDLSAIVITNAAYLVILLIPSPIQFRSWFNGFTNGLFLLINTPAIILNNVDLEYFRFQGKRTTADVFELFKLGDDMQNTLPQMAKDFWLVLAISAAFVMLIVLLQKNTLDGRSNGKPGNVPAFKQWLFMLFVLPVAFLGARGSVQLKPLRISNAAAFGHPGTAPLALNTPFTVIKTIGVPSLELRFSMEEKDAQKIFSKVKQPDNKSAFKAKNVVLIILESFSHEYSALLSGKAGYTPFLDSLMQQSLYFTNAYANAKKSIDGIPAITSSLPSLLPASFITSPYSANRISSIAGMLTAKGYSSAFFHGGNNGTMGFDVFAKSTNHQHYFGRKEYGEKDYDGHWGVFDEPFYHYVIDACQKFKQPFAITVFSLSSHHPYSIPNQYKNRFPKGTLPIHESIGYADYSLRRFFESASKTDWYANTIFVITADHTGPSADAVYGNRIGVFKIPLLIFIPDGSLKGRNTRTTQQADILPTVMDYLNYDRAWFDFGTSVLDTTADGFAVNFTGDLFQIVGNGKLLQFDGSNSVAFYDLEADPMLEKNLIQTNDPAIGTLELKLKSVLTQYHAAMKNNTLTPRP